jgi:hypothetical protein
MPVESPESHPCRSLRRPHQGWCTLILVGLAIRRKGVPPANTTTRRPPPQRPSRQRLSSNAHVVIWKVHAKHDSGIRWLVAHPLQNEGAPSFAFSAKGGIRGRSWPTRMLRHGRLGQSLRSFFRLRRIVAFAINCRHFAAHRPQVRGQLAAMVNRVQQARLQKNVGRTLE